ncbi:MAG: nitrilase-related carbon-nitrogen hydrolase [Planctomycetota bacterium]|nr:nitrilase-related carbon-nitrogen hydrolase [Planctomycetota bacterium]
MSTNRLTACIAQLSPRLGDVEANLASHLEAIGEAAAQDARLVVFPELSLTGYRLRDLTYEVALRRDDPVLAQLAKETRSGPDIIAGFVEESDDHRFYNAAAYFSAGRVVHWHRKVYLPTYGLFEEGRFFACGADFRAFDTGLGRVGILICEDVWHLSSAYAYFLQSVDWLAVISSGPGRGLPEEGKEPASGKAWNSLLIALATFFNCGVLYCNRVGWEDGVKFWGGSKAIDPFGEIRAEAGQVDPELCFVDLDPADLRLARINTPIRRDERPDLLKRLLDEMGQ